MFFYNQRIGHGGCRRTRTFDPLIKSPGETQQNQCCFPQFMGRSTYCKALKLLELPLPLGNRRSLEYPNDLSKNKDRNRGWHRLRAITSPRRSIDLADLKRLGLLKPIVGGHIRAITWKRDDGGLDKLGIIPRSRGIRFVKRDDQGELAGLFVPYFYTPTMFGGYRKWFACPGCRRPARILYGVNSLRCRRCRGL